MEKIKLVVADGDQDYVDSLAAYILDEYPFQWEICTFNQPCDLEDFWYRKQRDVDILLLGEGFNIHLPGDNPVLTVLLVTEENDRANSLCPAMFKYLRADRLVDDILRLYMESHPRLYVSADMKKTEVIAVFSAQGGAGKTTVAAGLCAQAALSGKEALYLNFEDIPSTMLYFEGESEYNLASLFHFIREGRAGLAARLKKARCRDPWQKVYFYRPPASFLDFEEDLTAELQVMLRELTAGGQYDLICLDLSSHLNKNNLFLLEACHRIILVMADEAPGRFKNELLTKELEALGRRGQTDLLPKSILVRNKATDNGAGNKRGPEEKTGTVIRIPLLENITAFQGERCRLDLNSPLGEALFSIEVELGG